MPQRSRFALAVCLAASAALHVGLVAQLPGFPIRLDTPDAVLSARLVTVEPPAPAPLPKPPPVAAPAPKQVTAPKQAAAPKPAASPPRPASVPPPAADAITWPAAEAPLSAAAEDIEPIEPVEEPADAPQTATAASELPSEPTPAPAPAAVAETAPEPMQTETGTIRYEVYYGSDRFSIGRSVQTWSIDKRSYRLTSFSETTGLLGLFRPYQYAYVTEGRVEPDGLKPEAFTVRRGRDGERQATAFFDWTSGELTYGRLGSTRKAALNRTSYDLLTLFYQLPRLALSPGRLEVSVTTGTKFNTYQLEVSPEEMLELPIGTVRAIPVRQVRRPGQESIAVWFAPERHYLPVRIVFLDEQGDVAVEQIATQIAVGTMAADGR